MAQYLFALTEKFFKLRLLCRDRITEWFASYLYSVSYEWPWKKWQEIPNYSSTDSRYLFLNDLFSILNQYSRDLKSNDKIDREFREEFILDLSINFNFLNAFEGEINGIMDKIEKTIEQIANKKTSDEIHKFIESEVIKNEVEKKNKKVGKKMESDDDEEDNSGNKNIEEEDDDDNDDDDEEEGEIKQPKVLTKREEILIFLPSFLKQSSISYQHLKIYTERYRDYIKSLTILDNGEVSIENCQLIINIICNCLLRHYHQQYVIYENFIKNEILKSHLIVEYLIKNQEDTAKPLIYQYIYI